MKTTYQLALVPLLLCALLPRAKAQGSAEVYAAPGMRVSLPARRPLTPVEPKAALASPVFSRYWHQPGEQQVEGARLCREFVSRQVRYPEAAQRAGVAGTVAALLQVTPAGSVGAVTITHQDLTKAGPANAAPQARALAAELTRVVSQLRFEPATTPSDTITITQRFGSQ